MGFVRGKVSKVILKGNTDAKCNMAYMGIAAARCENGFDAERSGTEVRIFWSKGSHRMRFGGGDSSRRYN